MPFLRRLFSSQLVSRISEPSTVSPRCLRKGVWAKRPPSTKTPRFTITGDGPSLYFVKLQQLQTWKLMAFEPKNHLYNWIRPIICSKPPMTLGSILGFPGNIVGCHASPMFTVVCPCNLWCIPLCFFPTKPCITSMFTEPVYQLYGCFL